MECLEVGGGSSKRLMEEKKTSSNMFVLFCKAKEKTNPYRVITQKRKEGAISSILFATRSNSSMGNVVFSKHKC